MTVVGVMREGFEFPVFHDVWLPLRTAALDRTPRSGPAIILGYAIVMLGVCMVACVVPTRRALGIEPTIALRTE